MSASFAIGANTIPLPAQSAHLLEHPHNPWTEEAPRWLLAWLEMDQRPRLLATTQAEVFWMNAAAKALSPQTFPFSPGCEHDAREERRLDPRLLAEIGGGTSQLRCATAKPEFAAQPWVVWARALPGSGGPILALILRPKAERPNLAILAEAGQLTRAEIRVIEMMMSGTETAIIAQTLRISLETLRTHVKHAYRKLGVTTRGELFAAISGFMQP